MQIIKENKNIKNWEGCAEFCQTRSDCVAWTYRPKNKKPKKNQLCSIYSDFKDFTFDKYSFSGIKNCPTKATTSTLTITSTSTVSTISGNFSSFESLYEEEQYVSLYINDGNRTNFLCEIYFTIDLLVGMQFNVYNVHCRRDLTTNFAINALAGLSNFEIIVENNISVGCHFIAAFIDENNPLSQNLIQESIHCEPHCITIGGPASDRPCKFPFVWKGKKYWECTDIDHPKGEGETDLFCATEIDPQTKELKDWGICSRTCGYCYGTDIDENTRDWIPHGKQKFDEYCLKGIVDHQDLTHHEQLSIGHSVFHFDWLLCQSVSYHCILSKYSKPDTK